MRESQIMLKIEKTIKICLTFQFAIFFLNYIIKIKTKKNYKIIKFWKKLYTKK